MKRLEARGQPYDLVVVEPALSGPMSGYALCAWWRERAVSHEVAPTPLQQAVVQADGDEHRRYKAMEADSEARYQHALKVCGATHGGPVFQLRRGIA